MEFNLLYNAQAHKETMERFPPSEKNTGGILQAMWEMGGKGDAAVLWALETYSMQYAIFQEYMGKPRPKTYTSEEWIDKLSIPLIMDARQAITKAFFKGMGQSSEEVDVILAEIRAEELKKKAKKQ